MLTLETKFVTTQCAECGVYFGMPDLLDKSRREDGRGFFCPNGHSLTYGDNEMSRLRKEKIRLQQQVDQAKADRDFWKDSSSQKERSLRGTKAVVTRMKRRVSKGVCVCCSRKFKDLESHMKTRHPDWSPDKAAEALADKPEGSTKP